jgi:hypothetical protein
MGPESPSGDSRFDCGPSGYPGRRATKRSPVDSAEPSGGHEPTIGFRGDLRARSCAACDPDVSKAHPKSGRVTQRSRCPLRAQSEQDAGGDARRRSGPTTLFVIGHSARLIAYARFKGSLWNGFSRTGLRKHIVECTDTPLRGVLDGIKRALSERIVLKL